MLLKCGVEDSWESLGWTARRSNQSILKVNQFWIFIGRTDAETETPIFRPPDAKNWLTGKDWCWERLRQEEKRATEDEMVGWHHRLNGHEFEQAPGAGDTQGGLACCRPWGHKESDTTECMNWTELVRKDPDAGQDWRQEEKGTTEDEMVGWHHRLNGHELEQALGVGDGQGACFTTIHGVTKTQTWLSNNVCIFYYNKIF